MTFDRLQLMSEHAQENRTPHERHLNPQLVKVLETLGFDCLYTRAVSFGVFALGRNHPTIKRALHDALDADQYDLLKDVRGEGLMRALEFGPPGSLRLRAAWRLIE
jgi:ornithine--oxo-acid transaminase